MKTLWTYCHYDRFWHKLRRNAKRCPRCGAVLNNSAHRIEQLPENPNPRVEPRAADLLAS